MPWSRGGCRWRRAQVEVGIVDRRGRAYGRWVDGLKYTYQPRDLSRDQAHIHTSLLLLAPANGLALILANGGGLTAPPPLKLLCPLNAGLESVG